MKKYAKYIGLAIASLGVVGSLGLSYALYTKAPAPAVINIGYHVDTTADINYRIGTIPTPTGLNTDGKVDPDHNIVTIKVPLGAAPKDAATLQPYVLGKLTVTVEGAAAAHCSPSVTVEGFAEGKLAKVMYDHQTTKTFTDGVASLDNLLVDVTGHTADKQYALLTLTYDIDTEEEMLDAQNNQVSVTFNWGKETSFDYPYLVGTMTNWEKADQYKYRMVPNALADASWVDEKISGFQWYYHNFNIGSTAGLIKAKQGDTWSKTNTEVDANTNYDLFWSGSGSDDIVRNNAAA